MKVRNARRTLVTSTIAVIVCFAMLIGTTFAWLTDTHMSGINTIQSGNLDVGFVYTDASGQATEVTENTALFKNVDGEDILWEPGAKAYGEFEIANNGTLALKYEFKPIFANATKTPNGKTLANALSVDAMVTNKVSGTDNVMEDARLEALVVGESIYATTSAPKLADNRALEGYLLAGESITYKVTLQWLPSATDNDFNVEGGLSIQLAVALVATQMSFEKDGDGIIYDDSAEFPELPLIPETAWYDEDQTTFALGSTEEIFGLAQLVKEGNDFAGKTIELSQDISLDLGKDANGDPISFMPIGRSGSNATGVEEKPFRGTFDGKGHAIEDAYQSGWAFGYEWGKYGSLGLFGVVEDATIQNLTISGMEAQVEGGDIAFVAGSATGDCTFKNITIESGSIGTYNNGMGSIIGWSGEGTFNFENITIGSDVVLGGLWGSFDSSVGGLVGQAEPGATYNLKNVEISCRLDVYNDVTAAYKYYNYRMCGMIFGRLAKTKTVDGRNYPDLSQYNITFENVTVNFGDWMMYHYCVVAGKTAWRVEPGYAYGGIPADHDHNTCAMHHNLLLPFADLIGGDQTGITNFTKEILVEKVDMFENGLISNLLAGLTVNYPQVYIDYLEELAAESQEPTPEQGEEEQQQG